MYHCAQLVSRQKKPNKVANKEKQCDMHGFDCNGWLTVWACSDTDDLFVRLKHIDKHSTIGKDAGQMVADVHVFTNGRVVMNCYIFTFSHLIISYWGACLINQGLFHHLFRH